MNKLTTNEIKKLIKKGNIGVLLDHGISLEEIEELSLIWGGKDE